MRRFFGTDGIRGKANSVPMTADLMLKIGVAAARYFTSGSHRHRAVIGKDTRLSGYMIEPALTSGFISMGMDVILVGPMPTPAVAMLTRSLRADIGVMISASHNPYEDNGIKLFGPDGYKLSDEAELEIENYIDEDINVKLVESSKLGRARRFEDASGRYTEYVKSTFPRGRNLEGFKIAVDCANGAAYKVAPEVLWELGAEVVPIGIDPNGENINKGCGTTATDLLQSTTVAHGCDIGIGLDGDADRVLICDERGMIVDGDQIMGLLAQRWAAEGKLQGGGVVATVMSNLGLERYLKKLGLELVRTPVGDRYVMEKMCNNNYNLGGEQSGHIIIRDYSTTGDGLIGALQVLAVLVDGNRVASDICQVFDPVPQVLGNVKLDKKYPLDPEKLKNIIAQGNIAIGKNNRLLVRESGTEPTMRVMVEGDDIENIKIVLAKTVAAIEAAKKLT